MRKILSVHSITGVAASLASISLMVKAEPRIFKLHALAYGTIAAVSLTSAIAHKAAGLRRATPDGHGTASGWIEGSELSEQQRCLTLEILEGKTMKEIAFQHKLAYSTVRTVLSKSYGKLKVSGMTELAVKAALCDAKKGREDQPQGQAGPPQAP